MDAELGKARILADRAVGGGVELADVDCLLGRAGAQRALARRRVAQLEQRRLQDEDRRHALGPRQGANVRQIVEVDVGRGETGATIVLRRARDPACANKPLRPLPHPLERPPQRRTGPDRHADLVR